MKPHVIVYTQPFCQPCRHVKELLTRLGVAFETKDISRDADAQAEFERLGFRSTPVTVIDGEAIVGYAPVHIEELLKGK
jgi:glutaredoxin-like protein NrdH